MIGIYRIALHLLPADLRRKHGADMETSFARELQRARARGTLHENLTGVRAIGDVVQRSAYELVRKKDNQMGARNMSLPTTRQLLRRHAFSFAVAFVALTALMLFQFASRQVTHLSARGDAPTTIVQALLLAVPFIAAMTIPMSVLIAVLYQFARLGADGTLAAARLTQDGVRRLVVPILVAATGMTVLAFVVTAEIVPRTNERLASLQAGHPTSRGGRSMTIGALREAEKNAEKGTDVAAQSRAASYEVEIQKSLPYRPLAW